VPTDDWLGLQPRRSRSCLVALGATLSSTSRGGSARGVATR
jgi:hypothetical protein